MNLAKNTRNTVPGGGSVAQACAACKYQRRRCPPDCPLAPHFPADKQDDFRNVRKLFGVKNISRTLNELPLDKHPSAVHSIVFEANTRAADPVGGCLRKVRELNQSLRICTAELNYVRSQLAVFRSWVPHKKEETKLERDAAGFTYGPLGFDHQQPLRFEEKSGLVHDQDASL